MSSLTDSPVQPVRRRLSGDTLLLGIAALWLLVFNWIRPLTLPDEGR
jgi:hypothetical protein